VAQATRHQRVAWQQIILLYAKTRSMPDRIVNLVQRHARPIVRCKARVAVEFGSKISVSIRNGLAFLHRISWDPYNELKICLPKPRNTKKSMAVIPSEFVPIASTSTPRTETSAPGTTYD
jgi:hypothetical protein